MKYHGTLVRALADQGDRDGLLIDPAGVEYVEGRDYPLTAEFDLDAVLGYGVVSRAPDGSLTVAGEIVYAQAEDVAGLKLAAGIAVEAERIGGPQGNRVARSCRLNAIGLTPDHSDPGQPVIEVIS